MSESGAILLADFGLAIDCGRERPSTRLGTLDYMAPEGVPGSRRCSAAAAEGGVAQWVWD